MLENMEHRGKIGYEKSTGDGAEFKFRSARVSFEKALENGFYLPDVGDYGLGMLVFS